MGCSSRPCARAQRLGGHRVTHSKFNRARKRPATLPKRMIVRQLGLYFIVGGICFFVDIGGFIFLRLSALPILPASALSFVTATFVNYSLCCSFVFRKGRFSSPEEIARLFLIALVGFGLNSLVVLFLARILLFNPRLSKIVAASLGILSDDASWFSRMTFLRFEAVWHRDPI
jgi:putative flippase GtrA